MSTSRQRDIAEHARQARYFLQRSREYLDADDLHQTSEKGWGAAAHMAKAVALAQGWEYERHSHFHRVMNQAARLVASDRQRFLNGRAEILHVNFYDLRDELDEETIREDLRSMAGLLDLLEPLAESP